MTFEPASGLVFATITHMAFLDGVRSAHTCSLDRKKAPAKKKNDSSPAARKGSIKLFFVSGSQTRVFHCSLWPTAPHRSFAAET